MSLRKAVWVLKEIDHKKVKFEVGYRIDSMLENELIVESEAVNALKDI